jgi:hypothetical protein
MATVMHPVIDTLETAADVGVPLLIELRDGRSFADGVCEVLHEYGDTFVVFHANNRHPVRDIARAELLDCQSEDDIECQQLATAAL